MAVCLATAVAMSGQLSSAASAWPNAPAAADRTIGRHHAAHGDRHCNFEQLAGETGAATISQDYETALDAYDATAADDFQCGSTVSRVRRIEIGGVYFGVGGPGESMTVLILANNHRGTTDEPSDGEPVCAFRDLPIPPGSESFSLRPGRDRCRLKAGRPYWLQAQIRMDFETAGQWGWKSVEDDHGSPADWKNPGDGFHTGCTTYARAGAGGDRDLGECTDTADPGRGLLFAVR
jgi:hypothetical protein